MSQFLLAATGEDLLINDNSVEWVEPSVADKTLDEVESKFSGTVGYIAAIERPAALYDVVRDAVDDGNYPGAIAATGALNEGLQAYVEVESFPTRTSVMGLLSRPGNLDMLSIHKHIATMEGFFGEVADKIKAFFKWCYEKIANVGGMIKGWFTSKDNDAIKAKLETIKDKRLSQYEVKGATYTYNGDKPLTSSVQLASSVSKVAELFKRYHDYVNQVNTHLNELATDEGRLKDNANNDTALSTFIGNINKVIADKKTDEVWLGFTFRPSNKSQSDEKGLFGKVIFALRSQKTDRSGKSTDEDVPVTPAYKMDVVGKDLITAHGHFEAAEKSANEFTSDLEKLMSRLKVVETALSNKADEENSAKVYKTVRTALEVSGDVIKNIGQASTRLAEAKKYWCITVVDAVESGSEKSKSEGTKKPEDNK